MNSLLSRFEVTEAKRPLLKIAGFTGKDFKLGRLMYPHRMRAERLFVAAATTVLWFLQRQFLPRNVQRLCVRARETLSVFVQAFSPKLTHFFSGHPRHSQNSYACASIAKLN